MGRRETLVLEPRTGGLDWDWILQLLGSRVVGGAPLRKLELLLKKRRSGEHLFDGSISVDVDL